MVQWAMKNVTEDGKYQMIMGNQSSNSVLSVVSSLSIAVNGKLACTMINLLSFMTTSLYTDNIMKHLTLQH